MLPFWSTPKLGNSLYAESFPEVELSHAYSRVSYAYDFPSSADVPLQIGLPTLPHTILAIKGVAILAIVLAQAFRGWFGWMGVHIFIVLSGFLLSLALQRRRRDSGESIQWVTWARRRSLRLLPPCWLPF